MSEKERIKQDRQFNKEKSRDKKSITKSNGHKTDADEFKAKNGSKTDVDGFKAKNGSKTDVDGFKATDRGQKSESGDRIKKNKKKRELIGTFISHKKGFGFVRVEGEPEDFFVSVYGAAEVFHLDTVRIRVLRESTFPGKKPEATILQVIKRNIETLTGTFIDNDYFGVVIPDDPHIDCDIHIKESRFGGAGHRDKVVVRLLSYKDRYWKAEGEVIKVFGNLNDPETDVKSVIYAYGIEEEFPPEAISEARRIPRQVEPESLEGRRDFRDKLTVTIDGEDARDLDDAITLERNEDGYLLGVHIADVSYYVKEGSPLDQAALSRGTSVYFPDRVIPMLPKELSNGICSLNQGVERLTLSCMMQLDKEGNVIDHQIVEGVIRVDRRLSYTGVQAVLDERKNSENGPIIDDGKNSENRSIIDEGDNPENRPIIDGGSIPGDALTQSDQPVQDEDINQLCYLMAEAAALLKEKRRQRGSIDFDFPESKIVLDEDGKVKEVCPYERNTATDIIEDFMLLANETVACDYYWQDLPFVYRIHESPDPERLKTLGMFIRNFGYHLRTERDIFHPKEIQKLLFSLEGEPEEPLISRLALRAMQRARYNTVNLGHFGLSADCYTHFTSPIRRYPDLQIHRIIRESLQGKLDESRIEHYEKILPDVTRNCSDLEQRATEAERDVEKLKKIEYMEKHLNEHFKGVISGVSAAGLFVTLENTVEGMVPMLFMVDDYYLFDEVGYRLVGELKHKEYTLGQTVDVIVFNVNKERKFIDFKLEEFCHGES